MPQHSIVFKREDLHRTFGGYIYAYDYDRVPLRKKAGIPSETASRIVSDRNFDYVCKLNALQREMKRSMQEWN